MTRPTIDEIPPQVVRLFNRFALEAFELGYQKFSAEVILNRIRWEEWVEKQNREFKCNNNWKPTLARHCMAAYPQLTGFFETREPGQGRFEGM